MSQTTPAATHDTTPRRAPVGRLRGRAALSALALAGLLVCASAAQATPGKSSQWISLTGSCDGIPAVILDPPGPGPTAFSTLTGKMGDGRLFESVYAPTGQVVDSQEYGQALEHANQPITTCEFPVPPEFSPDGTSDWIFRVTGFFHG